MCVYIYALIYIYISIYTYVHVYVYLYLCLYLCLYPYRYLCIHLSRVSVVGARISLVAALGMWCLELRLPVLRPSD